MSRLIGFAGIAVLVVSGVFALFGYTKISYFLLAVAAVDLMVARIYQPDESNERVSDSLCAGAWFTSIPRIGWGKPRL
nr:hypothetical protein [Corynebacterium sp. MSK189]